MKYIKDLPDKPGYYVVRGILSKIPYSLVHITELFGIFYAKFDEDLYSGELTKIPTEFEWLSLNDEESLETVECLNAEISDMRKAMQETWDKRLLYPLTRFIKMAKMEPPK